MNKLIKGAVAGAAGIALLLGGAGTFALWNSSATVSAQTINAGVLTVAAASDGVWKDGSTTINPTTYRVVPGKTLVYTQTLNITATGDDLTAALTYSGLSGSGTLATAGASAAMGLTKTGANITIGGTTAAPTVAVAPGTGTVVVTVTLTVPSTITAGQSGSITLSAINFTLTQTI